MKKIALIENLIPSYRVDYYNRLSESGAYEFTVFCQVEDRAWNLELAHDQISLDVETLPYIGLGRQLKWQRLPLRELWSRYDAFVFYANPRYLSNFVWATVFRILGRKVILRNQAFTAGANPISEWIRLSWYRQFENLLVYTDHEVKRLRDRGLRSRRIVGYQNGLNQGAIDAAAEHWMDDRCNEWRSQMDLNGKRLVLSVARLERKNRFDLVIEAVSRLRDDFPDLVWCLIGGGTEEERLRKAVKDCGLESCVRFVGPVYDENLLAPWFLCSDFLIHPGAIGLTLLHAFGYGLPVVTHDNSKNQMPEFAALRNGKNGLLFVENQVDSLVEAMSRLLGDAPLRQSLRAACLQTARSEFNTAIMAERFIGLLDDCFTDETTGSHE